MVKGNLSKITRGWWDRSLGRRDSVFSAFPHALDNNNTNKFYVRALVLKFSLLYTGLAGTGNERAVEMSKLLAAQTVNRNLAVFKLTGHIFEKVNHLNARYSRKKILPVPVKF